MLCLILKIFENYLLKWKDELSNTEHNEDSFEGMTVFPILLVTTSKFPTL